MPDLAGLTLLVIDDNNDSLDMLATFLRSCGSHVLEARGALSALSYVETQGRIDAIVSDLSMPAMDGVEFVRRSPPSILRKPVNLDELCALIRSVVGPR